MATINHYYAIVVGAGIVGSSAAKYLQTTGHRTLLLEQFTRGHTRGSSIGESRIIRRAYDKTHYAMLMNDAYEMWEDLQKSSPAKFFFKTGLISSDIKGSPQIDQSIQSLKANNYPFEQLTPEQVSERWPQLKVDPYNYDKDRVFVYDPAAGILRPPICLRTTYAQFETAGGTFLENARVSKIATAAAGPEQMSTVSVTLEDGRTFTCNKLVLVPGAWANKVLRLVGIQLPLKILRLSFSYRAKSNQNEINANQFATESFPCMIWKLPWSDPIMNSVHTSKEGEDYEKSGAICVLSECEYPGLVKMYYDDGPVIDPDTRDKLSDEATVLEENNLKRTENFVDRYLPGLHPKPVIIERCMYTMAPDHEFIIDYHPNHKNIIIGSCCSGHGFKLGPVSGRLLGQLAIGNPDELKRLAPTLEHFRLGRSALAGMTVSSFI